MNRLKEYRDKNGVLIAVHRGTNGGNVIQNTTMAYLNAIAHKGDIVEVDVIRSKDGEFFAFHDGQEKLVFNQSIDIRELNASEIKQLTCFNSLAEPVSQKLETIKEVLSNLEGKAFININRSWFYGDTFLEDLKEYPAKNQVLLKAPAKKELLIQLRDSQLDTMFMPIIKTIEELEMILSFEGINIVDLELIFTDLQSELIKQKTMERIHQHNLLTWVNTLRLNDKTILSALLDDNAAILDGSNEKIKAVASSIKPQKLDWEFIGKNINSWVEKVELEFVR